MKMTRDWHPDLRRLIALSDPTTIFRVNIRTSVPVSPWQSSNVTLLGDAIHTMTPGRGVGANTAMRDASLLCRRLTEVRDGVRPLVEALHAYEAEMLEYSARAVLESRKQMDANGLSHRPVLGRIQLAVMRGALRIINAVPALKRRMTDSETRLRKIDNKHEFTA
jgi:2-polyprenyl-6-methoxyphenol hydroxylase-like FAD-dependent oxidoreductase